jgi:hypothetical protein
MLIAAVVIAAVAFAFKTPLASSTPPNAADLVDDDTRDGVMGALTEASKERKFVLLLLAPTKKYTTNKWAKARRSTEINRLLTQHFVFRFVDLSNSDNGMASFVCA